MSEYSVEISIEGANESVLRFYQAAGLEKSNWGDDGLRWAFGDSPRAFCVARKEGKIVGLSAYSESKMIFGSRTGSGLQAMDSYVSESMRGKGLFSKLASEYHRLAGETGGDLIWGFPNDNAAPAWFGKLGWTNFGQVPFLVRPLRAGFFLRRLKLGGDFPLGLRRGRALEPLDSLDEWVDSLWHRMSASLSCATIRDRKYLHHRLFEGPLAQQYRVVGDADSDGSLVASRVIDKHGGRIGYIMEAMGVERSLKSVLKSELAWLRGNGAELALAWAFPWSPNYKALRSCGFFPLPQRLRPIRIWFGCRPVTETAAPALNPKGWYLSYLDSDTV